MQLCFASNNAYKLSEIRALLEPGFRVLSLQEIGCFEELAETQHTLEGNSRQKAEYVFKHYKLPCFADDSGLEVDALQGAPGVQSARYAGDQRNSSDNIELLLKNLSPLANRKARFRTIITLIGLKGVQVFEGIVEGEITPEPKGSLGFGYDPVFKPVGYTRTFAEMDIAEKNQFSHRSLAMQKLIAFLKS